MRRERNKESRSPERRARLGAKGETNLGEGGARVLQRKEEKAASASARGSRVSEQHPTVSFIR